MMSDDSDDRRGHLADLFTAPEDWAIFARRLDAHFPRLHAILTQLYGSCEDFTMQVDAIMHAIAQGFLQRSPMLRRADEMQPPDWFMQPDLVGGMCYVDRYAHDLAGMRARIPYLRELGITYLHLLPLFRCPPRDNDGGYAVSSFREVRADLGTSADLRDLATDLRATGITLALDFVLNHVADDHMWAQHARQGEDEAQRFFYLFPDRTQPDIYEQMTRSVLPMQAPGNFTWIPAMQQWVWTTFYPYQWDLNYTNPAVFTAMLGEMLFLANLGVAVLRLDAVPFLWKAPGTLCENLPQAHLLVEAFRQAAQIAAPSMIFKAEAVEHPREVRHYLGAECQIGYNPLAMNLLWEAVATGETALWQQSMRHWFALPAHAAWVNYLRSHDEIAWDFADEDAATCGIDGPTHRVWLRDFYSGAAPASFATGYPFAAAGDTRICGTTAALAGLERAKASGDEAMTALAIRRIVLLIGCVLGLRGIPLLYLGDEIGAGNDYSYRRDPALARDHRWLHRPFADPALQGAYHDDTSSTGRIFAAIHDLIAIRRRYRAFAAGGVTRWLTTANPHIAAWLNHDEDAAFVIVANFAAEAQSVALALPSAYAIDERAHHMHDCAKAITLEPYGLLWLRLLH